MICVFLHMITFIVRLNYRHLISKRFFYSKYSQKRQHLTIQVQKNVVTVGERMQLVRNYLVVNESLKSNS